LAKIDDFMHLLRPLARSVAAMMGPSCEVVIHDFGKVDHSIVYIENGHVTGRQVGDTLTNLGLQTLYQGAPEDDYLNYATETTDGRTLKSSSVFVRDRQGNLLGALCLNFDTSQLDIAVQIIKGIVNLNPTSPAMPEKFTSDVNQLLERLVEEAIASIGRPPALMSREEKQRVVELLEPQGAFLIKRSVERVATALDVSRFTVYSYLDEIRTKGNVTHL
jgi:predicted transcriptional regulator YheO